jgi:class 3 adenylate cyclase
VAQGSAAGAGRSTAIVLFTDLVGSTELRSRLGEDAAEELRRDHDRLIAGAVEANRGRLVKHLGDGVRAASMVEVTGNTILMNFDKNIVHAARGVVVNDGAVQDFQGRKSPARTIKL